MNENNLFQGAVVFVIGNVEPKVNETLKLIFHISYRAVGSKFAKAEVKCVLFAVLISLILITLSAYVLGSGSAQKWESINFQIYYGQSYTRSGR